MTASTNLTKAEQRALYEHYGLTCPPLYGTMRNFDRPTFGGKVAKLAAILGTPLMPWQRYAADTSLEIDPATGTFAYRNVGITVPRQSGKTSLILPVAVHRGMAWQRQRILYAAQSGTAAREKWEDEHVEAIKASKLWPRVRVRRANAREAIIWKATRSMHGIMSGTAKAGHGKTLHLGMADEYFSQVDYRIDAAWSPAMITVPSAQKWWLSTAGTKQSVPLNAAREKGREIVLARMPTRTAYMEWAAPLGADHTDPRVHAACMPAIGYTVTPADVAAELETLDLAEFLRAYMNWTTQDDEVVADPNVPTLAAWDLLADAGALGGEVLACAIDVTPSQDHAAIVAAGEGPEGPTGARFTKVLEHGPGTGWVVGKVLEIQAKLNPVAWAIDDKSQANTLLTPLEQAGLIRIAREPAAGQIWVPSTSDVGAACGSLAIAIRQGTLAHPGQASMSVALGGARTRPLGDGLWAFGRKQTAADISPLVATALALAAYERFRHLAGADYDLLDSVL